MRTRVPAIAASIAVAVILPAAFSSYLRSLSAMAAIAGLVVLSLVLLTGFTGQISFSQYSFAAVGAFTVGSLAAGHHWNFWFAALLGVAFAGTVGVLVGIPALRLSGLFLAILTVAVALVFDRFLLAPGTWNAFSGGVSPWRPSRPGFFGIGLDGSYAFYLFCLGVFLAVCLVVWNLRRGKTGRVLRAIRESEVAAQTIGFDLTLWKLGAFGVSAAICGIAGALTAVAIGSVSPASYDFLHSIQIAAAATVMGMGSLASAPAAGIFVVFGPELLRHTALSTRYFSLILGAALIAQLVLAPEGIVTKTQNQIRRRVRRARDAAARPPKAAAPAPAEVAS